MNSLELVSADVVVVGAVHGTAVDSYDTAAVMTFSTVTGQYLQGQVIANETSYGRGRRWRG